MTTVLTYEPSRVCAWCKLITHIGRMRDGVSHGICSPCLEIQLCV